MLLEELHAWSSVLSQTGSYLIRQRKKFVEDFLGYINRSYEEIMNSDEKPFIEYSYLNSYKGEDIEEEFSRQIIDKREEEIIRGLNLEIGRASCRERV